MQQVIEITAPFFGLIFLGTFLKSINFLNEEKTIFLSRFAFYALMPVMLFQIFQKHHLTIILISNLLSNMNLPQF